MHRYHVDCFLRNENTGNIIAAEVPRAGIYHDSSTCYWCQVPGTGTRSTIYRSASYVWQQRGNYKQYYVDTTSVLTRLSM